MDPLDVGQDPRNLHVFVERRAADVHHHGRAPFPQFWQPLADEAMHADPLQTDGVEHAGRSLDDAGRRVSFALGEEQSLDRHGPETGEIDDAGVFDAVSEAAAGRDERVGERQGTDRDRKIHLCL